MIKSDIISIIERYPLVALAVSGGSDSMAMAEWFRLNRPKGSFCIINIDHNIRGDESKRDSAFVIDYCKQYDIECHHYDIDAVAFSRENGYTLEQGARILRHRIFEQACSEYAYVVATAHHLQDQAESIFMHIARGSGINGLIGMSCVDGHIIRPLINTSKEEIMQFINDNNIKYCIDSTNEDVNYSRNYTRHRIMPVIKNKFDNFEKNLIKLSQRALEIADFIDQHTPTLVAEDNCVICDFNGKHKVIKAEMIRRAFSLLGVTCDVEERHIDLIIDFDLNGTKGRLDMPYNIVAFKENNQIAITKNETFEQVEYSFGEGVFDIGGYELVISKVNEYRKDDSLYITVDNARNLKIRFRKSGDKIAKFGGGTKSLGDFLTDKKVPLRLKDRLPIIVDESQVYCVCGVDISSIAKVNKDSKNIYKIELIR